ncbi:MAG: gephyrin-like molybdotransferase Glp [Pseudomonadota bacterium]
MSKAPSCCDDFDPQAQTVDSALARILEALTPVAGREQVPLLDAYDRVLAADLLSPVDVPAWANSAMDGYALRAVDGDTPRRVVGTSLAGHPFAGVVDAGECVRIMTGAPMPAGADTVVMQEHVTRDGDQVRLSGAPKAGDNVRHAGEDLRHGSLAVPAGTLLRPATVGVLASLGIGEVSVHRRLRVAFFSTGDELQPVGAPLAPGQIYDSNRYTLHGMLRRLGAQPLDLGRVPDDPAALEQALREASVMADVVITSGGVSVGEADFVKGLLERLGRVNFWKINMKPGRPLAFGEINGATFFGLPGNPVSVMATFYQFVRPALLKRMGMAQVEPLPLLRVRCLDMLKKRPGRVEFQRGRLQRDANGEWVVRSTGGQGSHVLSSMSSANCFIVLPQESPGVEAGGVVEVQLWEGLV